MATIRPDPKSVEDVRRWRKESHEARQKMPPGELAEHDRKVAESLGLAHLSELRVGNMALRDEQPRRAG
jgi:prephenate dehydrogenase